MATGCKSRLALAALASMTLAVGAANADGMPRSAPGMTIAYDAGPSWSGFYVGTDSGFGWADTSARFPSTQFFATAPGQGFSTDPDGWIYGGHIGLNHQMGAWVVGAEVAYNGTTIRDTVVGPVAAFPADRFTTRIDELFMATGRLGYATGRWLAFAKGGYASADVGVSALSGVPVAGVTAHDSSRQGGWTAGAGVEYRLHPNMVVGLEYDYINLDGGRYAATTGGTSTGLPFTLDLDDTQVHTVMARFSILFGRDRDAPVPLK
jgi:outer membrane immunogenic protein